MSAAYEAVILFGVVFFFAYGFSALTRFRGAEGATRWVFQIFVLIVLGVYFVWFWSKGRRTLPMKTMSIRLETRNGAAVSTLRALGRFCAVALLVIAPMAGGWYGHATLLLLAPAAFLWCIVDRDRRTLYDRLAGTRLAVDPEPKP